jgi:hypothetical protein
MMPKFKASRATNSEVIAAATAERKRQSQAILKPFLSVRDCSTTDHDLMGAHDDRQFDALLQPAECRRFVRHSANFGQAAVLISIFLLCLGAGFCTVTFRTPLAISAEISSTLTPEGSSTERENEP